MRAILKISRMSGRLGKRISAKSSAMEIRIKTMTITSVTVWFIRRRSERFHAGSSGVMGVLFCFLGVKSMEGSLCSRFRRVVRKGTRREPLVGR